MWLVLWLIQKGCSFKVPLGPMTASFTKTGKLYRSSSNDNLIFIALAKGDPCLLQTLLDCGLCPKRYQFLADTDSSSCAMLLKSYFSEVPSLKTLTNRTIRRASLCNDISSGLYLREKRKDLVCFMTNLTKVQEKIKSLSTLFQTFRIPQL